MSSRSVQEESVSQEESEELMEHDDEDEDPRMGSAADEEEEEVGGDVPSDDILEDNVDDLMGDDDDEKPLDYDGDEEEEERGRRRSSRKRRVRDTSDDPLEDEEDEEEEDTGDDFVEKQRPRDDHLTLLAASREGIIHVGSEYQATIGETEGGKSAREDEDRDTAMWLPPCEGLNEDEFMEFCEEAVGIYMLGFDRALYILQKSNYDYKKALDTIACRKVVKEEWSDDDNLLFRQAFCLYGKNFARIRQTMPHRSMSSIIHHYYATKKQQDYKSMVEMKMDKSGFNDDGDQEVEGGRCDNCQEQVKRLFLIDESKQCNTCMLYFKLMQKPRPLPLVELPDEGSSRRRGVKIPEQYMDIVDDFVAMAAIPSKEATEPKRARAQLRGGDEKRKEAEEDEDDHMSVCVFSNEKTKVHEKMSEVAEEMRRVRAHTVRCEHACRIQKQQLSNRATFDKLRVQLEKSDERTTRVRMQYTWTDQEKITAFHCFVRYGRDFDAVAEVVGTKTPDMVKSFYTELKDDIDKVIDDAEEVDLKRSLSIERDTLMQQQQQQQPIAVVDVE